MDTDTESAVSLPTFLVGATVCFPDHLSDSPQSAPPVLQRDQHGEDDIFLQLSRSSTLSDFPASENDRRCDINGGDTIERIVPLIPYKKSSIEYVMPHTLANEATVSSNDGAVFSLPGQESDESPVQGDEAADTGIDRVPEQDLTAKLSSLCCPTENQDLEPAIVLTHDSSSGGHLQGAPSDEIELSASPRFHFLVPKCSVDTDSRQDVEHASKKCDDAVESPSVESPSVDDIGPSETMETFESHDQLMQPGQYDPRGLLLVMDRVMDCFDPSSTWSPQTLDQTVEERTLDESWNEEVDWETAMERDGLEWLFPCWNDAILDERLDNLLSDDTTTLGEDSYLSRSISGVSPSTSGELEAKDYGKQASVFPSKILDDTMTTDCDSSTCEIESNSE